MKKEFQQYKGFGISYVGNTYTATAYANPTFQGTNIAKIKRAINQYLRDEKYLDYTEIYTV